MPAMFRSGAFRSCETVRRKSSFSAISLLSRRLAASSCVAARLDLGGSLMDFSSRSRLESESFCWRRPGRRWPRPASRLARARSSCWLRTRLTISLNERASVPITSERFERHARLQVAAGDPVGGGDKLADRLEDPMDQPVHQRQADASGHRADQQDGQGDIAYPQFIAALGQADRDISDHTPAGRGRGVHRRGQFDVGAQRRGIPVAWAVASGRRRVGVGRACLN